MRRKRHLILIAVECALLMWACYLWIRGGSGAEQVNMSYDRYLADGSAASDEISMTSDQRLWFSISRGAFEPFNGQLVSGYHMRADQSGGRPRFWHRYSRYATDIFADSGAYPTDERAMSGWGPVRWQEYRRSGNGERYYWCFTIGVSHWLVVGVMFLLLGHGIYFLRVSRPARKARSPLEPDVSRASQGERDPGIVLVSAAR